MNDQTPRRYKGSLLERAAEQYGLAPSRVEIAPVAEPLRPVPVAAPEPVRPAAELVRRTREPILAREPIMAVEPEGPRLRRGSDVEPVAEAVPVAAPQPELLLEPEHRIEPASPAPEPVPAQRIEPIPAPPAPAPKPEPRPEPELRAKPEAPKPEMPRAGTHRRGRVDRDKLREGGMLVPGAQITALAEEFRMVKRQLLLTARAVAAKDSAKAADRARMILVCSAQANEGKTFCAVNLALSMAAEKDMEILLVDADFAKPDILDRLGLPEGPGLLDALSGAVDVEDCIVQTDVPQLSVLPAGAHSNSDTELLASDRARALLDGLAQANPRRIVIFDSPPALAASPASVLALHVGQVLLVVRADRTSESDLREAVSVLDGCEHIQLVLNSVSFRPGGSRFGSYYGEAGE